MSCLLNGAASILPKQHDNDFRVFSFPCQTGIQYMRWFEEITRILESARPEVTFV